MGVWEYDHARGLNHWDDRLCRMLGYDWAPPSVQDWLDLVHPQDRARVLDRVKEALAGADYRAEYRLRHGNGDWVWCESRGRVVRQDAQGAPLLTAGIQADISARKQRELDLRRLDATLSALVEGTPDAVFVKDCAGRYVLANQAAAALLGRSVDEVLGQDDCALFPQDLAERFRADDRRIMESGSAETYTEPVATVQGRCEYLITKGPLVIDGEVRGVFGMARDISERRQAEEALRRSEARLKEAQRIARVGHWEVDPAGSVLVWSEEMYRLTGFDPAQGPPSWKTYLQWVHPEDRDRVREAQREALRTGKPTRTELRNDPAKGPLRHFIRQLEPELDAAGRVVRLVGTCQDVTDLQQAKAQARRSDAMLDSVFQAIPDLFFLIDGDGTVRDYRAQRRSDLYVPPEHLLGRRLQDVLPARLAEVVVEKLQAALGQDGPVCLESDLDTPSGDHRYEARLSRLGDSGQCIAVVRDITEQHRARQALAESEQRYSLAAAIGRSGAWELWPLEGRLFFDHNLVRLMGYDRGDLSENLADWLAIIPQDGRTPIEDALQAIVEGRSDTLTLEHPVRRKDGSAGWIYLTGERVSALGEEPMRLVGSSRDITERKQGEIERNAQLAELRRWHEAMLGRETRVLELKREVNRLLAEAGRAPRYTSVADPEAPPGDG